MATRFVVVPEWQASRSDRAMRLVDGAEAIRGDLPRALTITVDVPLESGDAVGTGIHRASSLRLVHERTLAALDGHDGLAVTIGGDCGVSLAAVAHANEQAGGDLAVVWLDAHPDLNSPTTSTSGCFNGMVLRALTGDGAEGLVATEPVDPQHIVLAGVRSVDEGEQDFIDARGIRVVAAAHLTSPDALLAAIEATGAISVYLHIDVDVLDPGELSGVGNPVPFGVAAADLVALVRAVKTRFTLAGATIAEFAPASPDAAADDLPTLLRVIGAITA